jgi:hypothetical protein
MFRASTPTVFHWRCELGRQMLGRRAADALFFAAHPSTLHIFKSFQVERNFFFLGSITGTVL